MTSYKQKFLEEYEALCKKYGMWLFSSEGSSIAIVGATLKDEIVEEHIEDIKTLSKY